MPKIIIGDEIEVITPIATRRWKVARISDCGKWAITEGHDYFNINCDERGYTRKKGYREKHWFAASWQVIRLRDLQSSPE